MFLGGPKFSPPPGVGGSEDPWRSPIPFMGRFACPFPPSPRLEIHISGGLCGPRNASFAEKNFFCFCHASFVSRRLRVFYSKHANFKFLIGPHQISEKHLKAGPGCYMTTLHVLWGWLP